MQRDVWMSHGLQRPGVTGLGVLTALAGVALTTLLIAWLRSELEIPNVSMLYLPVVLAVGIVFGRASAIIAALCSFLAFNYFFVSPVSTLFVANPQEWLELLVLLLTAVVTGQLAATMRSRASEAEIREREIATLYDCNRILDGDEALDQRLTTVASHLARFYAAMGCEVLLPDLARQLLVRGLSGLSAEGNGEAREASVWAFEHGSPATSTQRLTARRWIRLVHPTRLGRGERLDVTCVPMSIGDRQLGVLRLVQPSTARLSGPREMRHLLASAGLIAQAVERDRLASEALEAEVLRRADQAKSVLLASVSHDLRTPLASIKASVTSLLDDAVRWPAGVQRELLRGVDEETDRLTRFVSQLLDLSRLESGAVQPRKDWHSVEEILAGVLERLGASSQRAQLEPIDAELLAYVDYVMVEQIVTNLVENAIKYSPPDTSIQISTSVDDGLLSVDVIDHGPGVPAADQERVFDRFYRTAGTRGAPGTGLGLAIARGLSRAHGGDVTYRDNPSGGSIFRLTLPAGYGRIGP
jgi:two-component system sensor histidine kinase KdpD